MNSHNRRPLRAAVKKVLQRHEAASTRRSANAIALLALSATALWPQARAADHTASNESELRQRILDANGDGDASSTITLTADITLSSSTAFPALTKPITIDTNGFTVTGQSGTKPGGRLEFSGSTLTVVGTGGLRGGNAADGTFNEALTGGVGIFMTNGAVTNGASITGGNGGSNDSNNGGAGGIGVSVSSSSLTNNASITGGNGGLKTGGAGGAGGAGGVGVSLLSNSPLTNNGIITGGSGGDSMVSLTSGGTGGTGALLNGGSHVNNGTIRGGAGGANTLEPIRGRTGGHGVDLSIGSLVNNGTIEGGTTVGGNGGSGAILRGTSTLTNSGTIRGSIGTANGSDVTNKSGVYVFQSGNGTITNTGTIEGGTGAAGVSAHVFFANVTLINSGTIRAGSGGQTAITFNGTTAILELHAGSVIEGNVLGSASRVTDTLRLGGTANSSFDVSGIGASSQYRNFDIFQKTNSSTWTLTGSTDAVTPWQLQAGTLAVSSDGNLGGAAGALTFGGGTLQNTAAFTSTHAAVFNSANGLFQTDADLTWSGTISGNGALVKSGNGALILSGNNAYTGATNVDAGTLRVNGNQSTATGLTTVASGATLGGNGTIGGAVTIADGGRLAPGNSPGTLNMGTLTLNAGSILDFELGEADVAGGLLNDLINVNGDLTLDGTLNVTPSAGGAYGAGIYRLINYTGTLTDNGLELGLLPAGSVNHLQTSIAHQVNLINTHGLEFSYWDGPNDPRDNGVIGGGSGAWLASDDNWATADGTFNMSYLDGTMAVFAGTPGTVTVDASSGDIRVAGMQFATDGYRIEGNAIALTTGLNAVRVGDGTPAGAAFTATIDSELTGAGALDKTDLGTLVLTAANTYTGGTTISAGTLALSGAGSLAAHSNVVANAIFDISATDVGASIGTLTGSGSVVLGAQALTVTTAEGNFGVVNGAAGTLNKGGAGTWTLTGAGSQIGTLNVQSGAVELIGGASLASNVTTISAGAALRNYGTFSGTSGSDTLSIAGSFGGSASFLDGDDRVQIADGASVSDAAFDGGAGVDTLELSHSNALTLPSALASNFEQLTKRGAGALTLAGTVNGFSDSIVLAAGSAHLDDATVNTGEFRIESGASLTGAGALTGNLVNAGTLSPGHSPGTIQVGGNFTQSVDGVLVSEITRDGTDLLDVAGTASLAGTHRIAVEYGTYLDGTTQTLIQTGGGIAGDFASLEVNESALMTAEHALSANAVTVSFARQPITTVVDPNSPRGRFAAWLEDQIAGGTLTPDMSEYVDMLLQQSTAQDASTLLRERGEPVASVSQNSVSILGAGFARTVFDRFTLGDSAQCAPAQQGSSDALNCFWGNGLRQWGQIGGDSRYDWTSNGGQIGVDRSLSSGLAVGGTFGYADTGTHDSSGGVNDARTKMGGVYASYASGPLSVAATAFYSGSDNSTRRSVLVGSTRQQARADFDTDSYGAGVRLSYRLTSGAGPLVRPYIEALYAHIDDTAIRERDAGSGNLSAHVHDRNALRGTLGLQLSETYEGFGRLFRPSLEVGVAHQFEDDRSTIDLQPFAGASSFRTYGPALDRTAYVARAALNVSLGANAFIALGYGGEIAEDYSQHEGNLSLRVSW